MGDTFDRDFLEEALRAARMLQDEAIRFRSLAGDSFRTFTFDMIGSFREANKTFDDLNTTQQKFNKFQIKQEETLKRINKLTDTKLRFEEKIKELKATVIPGLEEEFQIAKDNLAVLRASKKSTLEEIRAASRIVKNKKEALNVAFEMEMSMQRNREDILGAIENLEDYNTRWDQARQSLGKVGDLIEGIQRIPGLGKMFDLDKVMDAMKTTRMAGGSVAQTFASGFKALPKALFWLTAIVEGVKWLVDLFITSDKYLTRISRQFVVTKWNAIDILDNYRNMIPELETQYATLENILSAQEQINSQSLFSFHSATKAIDAQIQLTKEYHLSEEAATNLNKTLSLNNELGTVGLRNIRNTIQQYMKSNKVLINTERVMGKVSDISGELRSRFQGNVKSLTEAVLRADRLGLSLQQAKAASSGLLDFQSSIESELEAELLLNKQLNFERARMLALQGDYLGAQEAVLKQIGGYDDLVKLNTVQLNAAAKAAGMTADELIDQAATQKYLTGEAKRYYEQLGRNTKVARDFVEALKMNEGDFSKTTRQLDAQEKMAIAMQKAQDAFVSMAANNTLDKLANALNRIADGFVSVFGEDNQSIIKQTTERIGELQDEINALDANDPKNQKRIAELRREYNEQSALRGAARKDDDNTDWGWDSLKGSWIQRLFGATSHVEDVREQFRKNRPQDDFIMKGNTVTPFRKDDIILGGTKLLDSKQDNSNTEIVGLLKELISAVNNTGDVYMDSVKVGYAQKIGTFKSA